MQVFPAKSVESKMAGGGNNLKKPWVLAKLNLFRVIFLDVRLYMLIFEKITKEILVACNQQKPQ